MTRAELGAAWARQAHADADRGVIECRMCHRRSGLDETTTLWRNGALVFALCDRCASTHDVLLSATERGVEVRARQRSPILIRPRE